MIKVEEIQLHQNKQNSQMHVAISRTKTKSLQNM